LFSPDVAIINTQEKAALGAAFSCDSFITAVDCVRTPKKRIVALRAAILFLGCRHSFVN
jgi:hypothetical protein